MMEYDGALHVPKRYLVSPPSIDHTMGEYLAACGVRSLVISETQKYGHGNRTGKFNEKLERKLNERTSSELFAMESILLLHAMSIQQTVSFLKGGLKRNY